MLNLLESPLPARTKPVRVCFVIDNLSRAGTESQLIALIHALDRRKVLPFLCLLDGTDVSSSSLEPADCEILRLGVRSLLRPTALLAARALARFWRKHRIDIVQTYFLDSTYFGAVVAKLCGIRRIIRVRNNLGYWMTGKHRRLAHWMGRIADVTLTNSAGGKEAILKNDRIAPEKVAVLENGVDLERFPISPAPDLRRPTVRVGIVANLRPVKNVDGLIRVAARLRSTFPQLRYEIGGAGEQRAELERLIIELGLSDIVKLLGSIEDVPGFLARQEIAVLCSHSEGMSNALLEYMAAGRAIVATDVGANRRLIQHDIHGRIVPPGDDHLLAEGIAWLMDHPDAAQSLALAARQQVEANYSRSAMVRRFEEFYRQALTGTDFER